MKLFNLNKSRLFVIIMLLALLQQSIVASSNLWLVKLSENIKDQHLLYFYLGLYILTLLLPYIPGSIAIVSLNRWKLDTQNRIQNQIMKLQAGALGLWASKENKNKTQAILLREGPSFANEFNDWFYNLWDSFLNFALNIIVIATVLDANLLLYFILGLGLNILLIHYQKSNLQNKSQKTEEDRNKLTQHNQHYWDNVLLKNTINKNYFMNKYYSLISELKVSQLKLDISNQTISVSLAYLAGIPVLTAMVFKITHLSPTSPQILATVFLIPRAFQIINSSHFFIWQVTQWQSFKARKEYLENNLQNLEIQKYSQRVGNIQITNQLNKSDVSLKDINLQTLPLFGRYTITGKNGQGKSSYLLHLKSELQENAFYLPAHFDLNFPNLNLSGSTGQNILEILNNLNEQPTLPSVLLLDEWAANLDTSNVEKISKMIDKIAQRVLVFEVRHFHGSMG